MDEVEPTLQQAIAPEQATEVPTDRNLDLESLKALAHPLRVKLLDALSTYGCFTASGLAERLGESSGATSYHLRQLEKHGFVREVEDRGTGRERWWERTPGGLNIGSDEAMESAAGREAATLIFHQFREGQDKLLSDFVEHGHDVLSQEWFANSAVATMNTRLTPPQMRELLKAWEQLYATYIYKYKNQQVPGARPVQVQFNAFAVLDGEVTPPGAEGIGE